MITKHLNSLPERSDGGSCEYASCDTTPFFCTLHLTTTGFMMTSLSDYIALSSPAPPMSSPRSASPVPSSHFHNSSDDHDFATVSPQVADVALAHPAQDTALPSPHKSSCYWLDSGMIVLLVSEPLHIKLPSRR
jgi:hypothetical protein